MTMNSDVLARDLAWKMLGAACQGHSRLWTAAERDHSRAKTTLDRIAAATPAVELCRQCPVFERCEQWAAVDHYTGLAAAQLWRDGDPCDIGRASYIDYDSIPDIQAA